MLTPTKAPVQVYHLSASVLLCGPKPRAAAAAACTVHFSSESHRGAVNHRPQTDSCVVLSKEKYSDAGRVRHIQGAFTPGKRRVPQGLFSQGRSGSNAICVMLVTQRGL